MSLTPVTLPSGRVWSVRTLRRSAGWEAIQVRDRLMRQSAQAGKVASEQFARAKTLTGDESLDADEAATEALIRAARLSEAADGWVIQAVWTGTPVGAAQGPEATGTAMLDALDALDWPPEDVAYLAAVSFIALCVPRHELPGKLAEIGQKAADVIAAEGAKATAANDSAVMAEVSETVPFGEARGDN